MAFGWRLGGATVALYLAEGAIGLPVFAGTPEKGIGLAYMAGPTGGYLLGYLVAAVVVGWLAEKGWDRNVFTTLAAMIIGTAIILLQAFTGLGCYSVGISQFLHGAYGHSWQVQALRLHWLLQSFLSHGSSSPQRSNLLYV